MWKCSNCSEGIEDQFDSCWNCGWTQAGQEPTEPFIKKPANETHTLGFIEKWKQGLALGFKIYLVGLVTMLLVPFTIGLVAALCGASTHPYIGIIIASILGVILIPLFIGWLGRALNLENTSNKRIQLIGRSAPKR